MKRTNIFITEKQSKKLKELAAEDGVSASELIREAIKDYLVKRELKKSKK